MSTIRLWMAVITSVRSMKAVLFLVYVLVWPSCAQKETQDRRHNPVHGGRLVPGIRPSWTAICPI